ncbi:ATP-binding cassette domain-containing protein [Comamonas sp. NLF-1-9]|nr:ATP-binding cassette domain-containing protein [Comamonas sp. NLF-1-9]
MPELLQVENVWAGYGDAIVLEELGFSVAAGGSLALLGRNGMGKTTLLTTLMGATRLRRGRIVFGGVDITRMPSHERARLGLGWVPQQRDVFPSLTVEENLTVVQRPGEWGLERVYALFPRLRERRANMGNQLSGGERQMLAIGRALMLNPRMLLLDEPLEGLAPLIAQELLHIIEGMVQQASMAVILVEQHARQILPITENALVLERGRAVYAGDSAALLHDRERLEGWLGAGSGAESRPAAKPVRERIPAIDVIQNEHRAIAAVLHALSHIVQGIESAQIEPNFTLLASLIEYIAEMPDKVHHPKENQIFALLRSKTRELDAQLDRLEAEHHDAVAMTSRLDRALVSYVQGGAASFPGFRDAVRRYVAEEWAHVGTEEREILPVARRLFTPAEWEAINADFARNGDPWSGEANRYAELFKRITQLAPAPLGVGDAR